MAWTVTDQAISGATNAVATIVIARSVDATAFGAYGVAFVVYSLSLGVVRGLVGQPLAIRESVRPDPGEIRAALGGAVVLGAICGVAVAVGGLAIRGDVGGVLVVVGAALPGLLAQDALRFALFAQARPRQACVVDAVWFVAGGCFLLVIVASASDSVVTLTAGWAAGGVGAAVAGLVWLRLRPDVGAARSFAVRHRDLGPRLALEYLVHTGAGQVSLLVLGPVIGTVGIGAVRGAQTLYGPYLTLLTGFVNAAIPEGARTYARSATRLVRGLVGMSAALGAIAVAWAACLLALPDDWGSALLGDTWQEAASLLVPVGVACVGYGLASGGDTGLRITAAAKESLRIRVSVGLLTVAVALVGGVVGGVRGAAWALAVGPAVTAVASWRSLLGVLGRPAGARVAIRTTDS